MKFGVFEAPPCSGQTAPFLFNNYTLKRTYTFHRLNSYLMQFLKHFTKQTPQV